MRARTRVACAVALGALAAPASALKIGETFDDGALAGWTHSSEAKYTGARAIANAMDSTRDATDGLRRRSIGSRAIDADEDGDGDARTRARGGGWTRGRAGGRAEGRRGGVGWTRARRGDAGRRSEIARARATRRDGIDDGERWRWMGTKWAS